MPQELLDLAPKDLKARPWKALAAAGRRRTNAKQDRSNRRRPRATAGKEKERKARSRIKEHKTKEKKS